MNIKEYQHYFDGLGCAFKLYASVDNIDKFKSKE